MQIVLGTVQFGMDYGITNQQGQTSSEQVAAILNSCREQNIQYLDTAAAYGNAEQVLGINDLTGFKVITKLPAIKDERIELQEIEALKQTFNQSLANLNIPSIEGLLLHQAADCFKEGAHLLHELLSNWKEQGVVQKIGVSVYDVEEIERLLNTNFTVDIIQAPLNIFNQQLLQNDILKRLKHKGIEVHVRSVFLQGILLSQPSQVATRFQVPLEQLNFKLSQMQLTKMEAALLFVNQIKEVDAVLIGVNNLVQLKEITKCFNKITQIKERYDFSEFVCNDETIIDPRKW